MSRAAQAPAAAPQAGYRPSTYTARAYATPVPGARAYATPVPGARAYATPVPGARPYATAAPTAIPGVYKTYKAAATPVPTPVPGAKKRHTILVGTAAKPRFSLSARIGLPAPFGDVFPDKVQPLVGGSFEASYRALPEFEADVFYIYSSFKYKKEIADKPCVVNGGGIKAKLFPFEMFGSSTGVSEGFNAYGQFGMGYCSVFGARTGGLIPDPNDPTGTNKIDTVTYSTDSGIDFLLGGGIEYQLHPNFAVILDIAAHSISLQGGTGDSPGFILFSAGGKYTF